MYVDAMVNSFAVLQVGEPWRLTSDNNQVPFECSSGEQSNLQECPHQSDFSNCSIRQ